MDSIDRIKELNETRLEVGIFEEAGYSVGYDGRITHVADYARLNEEGFQGLLPWVLKPAEVPARPFLMNTIEKELDNIETFLSNLIDPAIEGTMNNKLDALGEDLVSKIVDKIDSYTSANGSYNHPLVEKYKKSKGVVPNKPLYDTGKLRRSIKYKVK